MRRRGMFCYPGRIGWERAARSYSAEIGTRRMRKEITVHFVPVCRSISGEDLPPFFQGRWSYAEFPR